MVKKVTIAYPNIRVVGTTLREVTSGLKNNWSAIVYADGEFVQAKNYLRTWKLKTASAAETDFAAGLFTGCCRE